MKTKKIKHGFFTLLIFSVLVFSFNGCSDDDDNSSDAQTFLELYAGTVWELDAAGGVPVEDDVPAYFRFVNDATKVLEGWYQASNEAECYEFIEGINLGNGVMSLLENSENKLVIKIEYSDETETYTCTMQGDIVTIVMVYEEVGFPAETYTLIFDKSLVNVDDLPLCP